MTDKPIASGDYDAARFAKDLEEVELEVLALFDRTEEQLLHFHSGDPIARSLVKVCLALVVRDNNACVTEWMATAVGDARKMLIEKNLAYGDSALNPVRVFATASPMEQLLVRLDDKVSRLVRGQAAGEDVARDMLGYLLLVLIAKKREQT